MHGTADHSSHKLIDSAQGIANRDLKLENLLLDRDGRDGTRPLLKICDFGYSKHEMNSQCQNWRRDTCLHGS